MRSAAALALVAGTFFLAGVAPAGAGAAGFSAPMTLSPVAGAADSPNAAIAANGRTAVLWRTTGLHTRDFQYVAALGPSPEQLAPGVVLPAGADAAQNAGDAALLARPDGGMVVCFGDAPRAGDATLGCATAPPDGPFGSLQVIARADRRQEPQLAGFTLRADGRFLLAFSRLTSARRRELRFASAGPDGRFGPSRPLGAGDADSFPALATGPDGTVAAAWSTATRGSSEDRRPTLRLLAPSSETFGPPVAFTRSLTGGVGLLGGRELVLRYGVTLRSGYEQDRFVLRLPDGRFSAAQILPRPAPGFLDADLLLPPGGAPVALVGAHTESGTDCGNITSGVVGAGSLTSMDRPARATRLSARGQIALYPQGAALDDGTLIASWGDANTPSDERLEVAIRSPGASAFAAPRRLPGLVARDRVLAAGGNDAVLVWVTGDRPDGPSRILLSTLRRTGPYAPSPGRPKRPGTSCG